MSTASLATVAALGSFALGSLLGACALQDALSTGGGSSSASDAGGSDSGDAGLVGAGCGIDTSSGASLCRATSQCPNVVVDSAAYPHCGFRIRGTVSELVCGCGNSICSMGAFTTCAQAAQLLTAQTEQEVCVQVAEERCTTNRSTGSSSSSSSSGSSGSSSTCDRQCLAECGGGAACASVCNCS
ncbi:hypothetical protein AKJ09_03978 [Labilithrix luteola]|uniref:Lipoprotein n=2 Tax=Labilithrix luteola TaxID=1391654 RepID=A0A0K1PW04_9BACT|nr:hypothetical protein AKJ09_03978 [Labilithrix luteola]